MSPRYSARIPRNSLSRFCGVSSSATGTNWEHESWEQIFLNESLTWRASLTSKMQRLSLNYSRKILRLRVRRSLLVGRTLTNPVNKMTPGWRRLLRRWGLWGDRWRGRCLLWWARRTTWTPVQGSALRETCKASCCSSRHCKGEASYGSTLPNAEKDAGSLKDRLCNLCYLRKPLEDFPDTLLHSGCISGRVHACVSCIKQEINTRFSSVSWENFTCPIDGDLLAADAVGQYLSHENLEKY